MGDNSRSPCDTVISYSSDGFRLDQLQLYDILL